MANYGIILVADDNTSIFATLEICLDGVFERILILTKPENILTTSYGNINDAKLLNQSLDLKVPFEKLDYNWLGSYKEITIKPKFK